MEAARRGTDAATAGAATRVAATTVAETASSLHRDLVTIALCLGLASGLIEGTVFVVIRAIEGWMTWQMRNAAVATDVIWIAPLVNAVLYLILAGGLAAVAPLMMRYAKLTGDGVRDIAAWGFAWLTCYNAIVASGRIYAWAALVLGLGCAVQLTRLFRQRREAALGTCRRALLPLSTTVVLSAVAIAGLGAAREAAIARGLPAPPMDRPNVLLLVLDTVRADHLSAYGYERATTPSIDALARQGVLFEHAVAPAPWTLPSHASLFTGLPLHSHKAVSQTPELSESFETLAESLAARGYVTGAFIGNTWWVTSDVGLDQGFLHFDGATNFEIASRTVFGREVSGRLLPRLGYYDLVGRKSATDVNSAFLSWLHQQPAGRPFFAFLNYLDAHGPYAAPEPDHTRFMTEAQRTQAERNFLIPANSDLEPGMPDVLEAAYDGSLTFLDRQIGSLFDSLRRDGILQNTLVILTSDHGEAFGEQGCFGHGHSLYDNQIRVPLLFVYPPAIPAGKRIAQPVSLLDVAVTTTSLVFPNEPPLFPGNSIATLWSEEGKPQPPPVVLAQADWRDGLPKRWPLHRGEMTALITPEWHFITQENGPTELYRARDSDETENLADTAAGKQIVQSFQQQLKHLPIPSDDREAIPVATGGM